MALIDLGKKVEIVLRKRGAEGLKGRVGFAMDVSGSMEDEYESGLMDAVATRIFALSARVDDDGSMDAWTFDNVVSALPPATVGTIDGYVKRNILDNHMISKWHGTSYEPPLAAALAKWFPPAREATTTKGFLGFGRKSNNDAVTAEQSAALASQPSLLVFLTDGDSDDRDKARQALEAARAHPIYISFVGVGTDTDFRWIREMGEAYPNVGFVPLPSLRGVDDERLYEGLVSQEMADWFRRDARAAA